MFEAQIRIGPDRKTLMNLRSTDAILRSIFGTESKLVILTISEINFVLAVVITILAIQRF